MGSSEEMGVQSRGVTKEVLGCTKVRVVLALQQAMGSPVNSTSQNERACTCLSEIACGQAIGEAEQCKTQLTNPDRGLKSLVLGGGCGDRGCYEL